MLSHHLRILIADDDLPLRLSVEKLLNQAGCYGVAGVATVDELLLLLDWPGPPLDLVLVNYRLLDQQSVATLERLQAYPHIAVYRHGLHSGRLGDPLARISEGLVSLALAQE